MSASGRRVALGARARRARPDAASDSGGGCGAASAAAAAPARRRPRRRRWPSRRPTRPTSIRLTTPIGKPIPTGKKVIFISCGVEACEIQGDIIKQGAADLGWTASTIGTDGSPEQLQNAFQTALRQGADAVILNAVNRAAVAKQIEEAKQQGRGVRDVLQHRAEQGDGILNNVAGKQNSAQIGENLAAKVVADSGGKANTLFVNISAFQILAVARPTSSRARTSSSAPTASTRSSTSR